jgi:hypothetical protein
MAVLARANSKCKYVYCIHTAARKQNSTVLMTVYEVEGTALFFWTTELGMGELYLFVGLTVFETM